MSIKYAQGLKVVPILPPQDITETVTKTAIVDLKNANWATLAIHFGAITCDAPTVTVKCSTAATTVSAVAIAFNYRLATGFPTDPEVMGAITAATTTGVALAVTNDNGLLIIDVDPAAVAAEGTDMRYLHALISPTTNATATLVSAVMYLDTRYKGNTIADTTTT